MKPNVSPLRRGLHPARSVVGRVSFHKRCPIAIKRISLATSARSFVRAHVKSSFVCMGQMLFFFSNGRYPKASELLGRLRNAG